MNIRIFLFSLTALVTLAVVACGGVSEQAPTPSRPAPTSIPTATTEPKSEGAVAQPGENDGESPTPAPTEVNTASENVGSAGEVLESGLTEDQQALMAQVLGSPDLMACLTGAVGLQTLADLADREPTDEETTLLQACLAEEEDGASALSSAGSKLAVQDSEPQPSGEDPAESFFAKFMNAQMQPRIDAAFAPTSCQDASETNYPSSYYQGPLIDSHFHIPALDDEFGGDDGEETGSRGVDAELYDSIAKEDQPSLGTNLNINSLACALQREGSIKAFAFFPVYLDIQTHLLEVASRTMEEYPSLFVPFIQSSGSEASIVEPEILQEFLDMSPDLFFGLGEVGDSPTEPINPPPDSVLYTENFEVAENNGLSVVYFHNGEGHHENLGRALERFPDITFITHGDFVRPHIDDLIGRYPNLYFTYNDIFDEHIPLFRFGDKQEFISNMERDWDMMLDAAFEMYGAGIEAHPDRYMWGTDRADIAWNYDEDIGILLAKYARAFIGRFDPEIQEKIAYKNAELLIANNSRP
jgi:hypothetical protein